MKIKDVIAFLSKFDSEEELYIDSFNRLCGGGSFEITETFILPKDKIISTETNTVGYNPKRYLEDVETFDTVQELIERLQELINEQTIYIEHNRHDWSESKIKKELEKLEEMNKVFSRDIKPVPLIFIHN